MRWVLPQVTLSDSKDRFEIAMMNAEQRTRMNWLSVLIQDERDPKVFDRLVDELSELLESNRKRLHRGCNDAELSPGYPRPMAQTFASYELSISETSQKNRRTS